MGTVAIIAILLSQYILLTATGIELKNSISDLGASAGQVFTNPLLLVVTVISMIITGAIVMLVAIARAKIAKHFQMNPYEIEFDKKRKVGILFSLLAIGVLTSVIFGGFNDFIQSASPTQDLNSLNSFATAIMTLPSGFGLAIATLLTIVVFGVLTNLIGHLWKPVTHSVEVMTKATHIEK